LKAKNNVTNAKIVAKHSMKALSMVETEFLEFEFKESKPKTEVWTVRNKHHGDVLGEIRYYPQWRQYCFIIPQEVMKETLAKNNFLVFSRGCHKDIDAFAEALQNKLKNGSYKCDALADSMRKAIKDPWMTQKQVRQEQEHPSTPICQKKEEGSK
jgi:hypothetical protein